MNEREERKTPLLVHSLNTQLERVNLKPVAWKSIWVFCMGSHHHQLPASALAASQAGRGEADTVPGTMAWNANLQNSDPITLLNAMPLALNVMIPSWTPRVYLFLAILPEEYAIANLYLMMIQRRPV